MLFIIGPLVDVNLPIDSFTRKPKGFATVAYMMPEHAIQAFTHQDGSVFQGRMLHLLPGIPKKSEFDDGGKCSIIRKLVFTNWEFR